MTIPAPHTPDAGSVVIYSTTWCGYCQRLKKQLTSEGIGYTEIDIEQEPSVIPYIEQVNDGNRVVPTVQVLPSNGGVEVVMTNPSLAQVKQALGV